MHRVLIWCVLFVLLPMITLVVAEDWPRFRGPNGTGESEVTTIPAKWNLDDLNWKIQLPGIGNSSPIVWGERLFILSADPDGKTRYVLCYHAITGGLIWEQQFASNPYHLHKMSSYASSTPAADAEFVYAAWATPKHTTVVAMRHTGEIVWQMDLGPWFSQHGFGTSPIVVGDLVILSCSQEPFNGPESLADLEPESFMIALDRNTGQRRWRTDRKTVVTSYSVPAIFQPRNKPPQLVSTSTGNGLFALDLQTGEELWSNKFFDKRTVSSPLIKGEIIIGSTGSGNGGNYLVAARSQGDEPVMAYKIDAQAPYVPAVVARGNLLFLMSDGGVAACVDLETGNPHWRNRIGGNYASSPVRAHDKIFCVNSDGEVVVLAAESTFEEPHRVSLGESCRATPAIAHGCIYFRTQSHLMSLGGNSRESVKQ